MKTINIYDLEVEFEYNILPEQHLNYPDCVCEVWPKKVELTSIKSKGIELITLLEPEQIEEIEVKLLEENQD